MASAPATVAHHCETDPPRAQDRLARRPHAWSTPASTRDRSFKVAGFTMLEILAVVIVLGILAGIAVPAYLNQRQKSRVASVVTDARNLGALVEDSWGTTRTYPAELDSLASQVSGARLSDKSRVAQYARTGGGFTLCVIYVEGSTTKAYARYDSTSGGLVGKGNGTGGTACEPTATDVGLGGNGTTTSNPTAAPTPAPPVPTTAPPTSGPDDWPNSGGSDLDKVQNLQVATVPGKDYADLTWNLVPSADGYAVFLDGGATPVKKVEDNSVDMDRTRLTGLAKGYHEVTVGAFRGSDHGPKSNTESFTIYDDNDFIANAHDLIAPSPDQTRLSGDYDSRGTGLEPGENSNNTQWWTFTAPRTMTYTFSKTEDSKGTPFPGGATWIQAWDGKYTTIASLPSPVWSSGSDLYPMKAVAGHTYTIQFGSRYGWPEQLTPFRVKVTAGPANDSLEDAMDVSVGYTPWTSPDINNTYASTQAGENNDYLNSVWLSFTAPRSGTYAIEQIGPSGGGAVVNNTWASIYKTTTTNVSDLPSNVWSGAPTLYNLFAEAGQTYKIRYSGRYGGAEERGKFRVRVTPGAPNDALAAASVVNLSGAPGTTWTSENADNTISGNEPGEDGTKTLWWTWTPTQSGTATFTQIANSLGDPMPTSTAFRVWQSTATRPADLTNRVAANNQFSSTFAVQAGQTYKIHWDNHHWDLGANAKYRMKIDMAP